MKNFKLFFSLLLTVTVCLLGISNVEAASGVAYIHYYKQAGYVDRTPTYSDAKPHLQAMGYSVIGYDAYGMDVTFGTQLTGGKIFVVHNHGNPGIQYTGTSSGTDSPRIIVGGTNAVTNGYRISAMNAGSMNNMKMVILYGCKTGLVTAISGNLPAAFVQKGATAAVAWTVDTPISAVNEWNRLFFEKAKTDTIVESYRHADYWTEQILGTSLANVLKNNRNEQCNNEAYIN